MLKKLNSTIKKKKKKNEDLYIYLTKEDIQMSHKQLKRCSTSYAIRELKMKITSYHYMPIRKSGILTSPNADKDLEQQEPSFSAGGDTKWCIHFRRQFDSFLQNKTCFIHTKELKICT